MSYRAAGHDDDACAANVEAELTDMAVTAPSRQKRRRSRQTGFEYLNLGAIARTYAEYGAGDLLQIILESFCIHFFAFADGAPLDGPPKCVRGGQSNSDAVHKRKGLEYDTIIFVGVDDPALVGPHPGDTEGIAAFFVALSQAKQRAIFAFCQTTRSAKQCG